MNYDTAFIGKLFGAAQLVEQRGNLDDGLRELAGATAHLLAVDKCSIMLVGADEDASEADDEPSLRIYAHHGTLPQAAYRQATHFNEGISGYVAATAKPLLIEDISQSRFAGMARHANGEGKSLLSAPILLGDKVIGVINISSPHDGRVFDAHDLELVNLFAMCVGKSIHITQLQNVLQSHFLQLAMALEQKSRGAEQAGPVTPDPAHLAKIVAKTIYRELTDGGFSPSQIIGVATEVIGQINDNLEKHKRRLQREHRA